jgi:hypothetical protein
MPDDGQDAHFGIDAHFLRSLDQQIAIGQFLDDDGRDRQIDGLGPGRAAGSLRNRFEDLMLPSAESVAGRAALVA